MFSLLQLLDFGELNSEQEKTISESKIWKHYKSLKVIFVYVYAIIHVKKRTHKHIQYGMVRKMKRIGAEIGHYWFRSNKK